ncbi:Porphyromonas-type peptidyl-arginine deiminase [Thermodesulforhabdus norvegica]|uniref:Porphyromonas-type peptidyl-arginine deiminase n=2 Tax=Thermodesulforhabdus norvegica TaxID=39841 RepID=A0A1I4VTN9_9BACT|nr:Porphyromonas-type peptidyl-arginine deiminase [Thermodesulforhabdus norvegica]
MIPEWKTNFLYFSELLPEKHPRFWGRLKDILKEEAIKYSFLPFTKDIWCRDYMPVQISKTEFVQFRYDPDYLKDRKYCQLKTEPAPINNALQISPLYSELILDGGNIIYSSDTAILTDKIFKENHSINRDELIKTIQRSLMVKNIYILPRQPYDIYGHADGMVRFIDDNTILINDLSNESTTYQRKLKSALSRIPFNIIPLTVPIKHRFYWAYINYIHIGNSIILPVVGHEVEKIVLKQFKTIFPDCNIRTINAREILLKGGGLHCISWNVKLPFK